jgi:cysteine desulfurase family protein
LLKGKGGAKLLYFDNAATTWPKPEEVYRAHDQALRQGGNAGRGVHQASLAASRTLFRTRDSLARLFKIKERDRIIFTQNVTESLNLALQGILNPGDHVLVSSLEHNAVIRPLEYLKSRGVSYSVVPSSPEGELDLQVCEQYIKPKTKLMCFTHASNVLGTILPVRELGRFARKHELLFMVDAAQSAGVIPIDVEEMNIDLLAFTGHKGLLGPPGTGGLFVREGIVLRPLIYGGTGTHSASLSQPELWPEGLESGTRNVPGLAGLNAGVEYILARGIASLRRHELELMNLLLSGLESIPGIRILGPREPEKRVGLVSCVFSCHSADKIASLLDRKYGIITRAGLHCAPLAHKTAGTDTQGALRISLGIYHTEEDIKTLLAALEELLRGE